MKNPLRTAAVRRALMTVASVALLGGLGGCYVVPIDPRPPATGAVLVTPDPRPVVLSARLYPANDRAGVYGPISASVTNDLHGRGVFNASIQGEQFVGEATRKAGSSREGLASGAGNRGGYLSCEYTMNSTILGTGSCRLHNGAVFTMHLGH